MTGTVVKIYGRYYVIGYGGRKINCVLRGKLRRDKRLEKYSEAAAVGDLVEFEMDGGETGAIEYVHERRNVFTRKYKESDRSDLIAANLDLIVVIQCFGKPRLNLRFVDRLMVRGEKEGIPVLLCVNKFDLAGEHDTDQLHRYYRGYNPDIILMSAKTGDGLDELKDVLSGKLSILIGNSGVGKTSILNSMFPGLDLRTMDISKSTGKGRHATTNVEMIRMDDNTGIIDTPGLREFGLMDIKPNELANYFMEFRHYASRCSFSPCTHEHEPGCEVIKKVENGEISKDRYISYLNIMSTLKDYYENRYR
ncbi:MAG: ribosome small subunit-dependent GTPase A [Spirochaetes bacterium RBG_13_51_14]|nr:MAG: ribosome small subunit-dependent GTPase A [Spirochaetes bacterium RBG_13_51_14]